MATYENPWVYQGKEIDSEDIVGWQGFVYQITDQHTGRKYIGKKNFITPKTSYKIDKITKKKKKIKSTIESDWKLYYGSNDELKKLVSIYGFENPSRFKRDILNLCKTKGHMGYMELRHQMDNRVLESDDFFNEWIYVRVHKKHIKSLFD